MKFNIQDIPYTYTEAGQKNPIRWMVLHKTGELEYENTTAWFKCKDYFNDFVAFKHGKPAFSVYGMKSSVARFDENGGMYVLAKNVLPTFEGNIQTTILAEFAEPWGISIHTIRVPNGTVPDADNVVLLWLSPECFVSTFRISLIMLLLRNCNTKYEFKSFDERLDQTFARDGSLPASVYFMLKQRLYNFPEQAQYAWRMGNGYHAGGKAVSGSSIHDNGIVGWMPGLSLPIQYPTGFFLGWGWEQKLPIVDTNYRDMHSPDEALFDDAEDEDEEECDEEYEW